MSNFFHSFLQKKFKGLCKIIQNDLHGNVKTFMVNDVK